MTADDGRTRDLQATPDSHSGGVRDAGAAARALDDGQKAVVRDASVHAKDTFSRGALRWGYFLLLNGIAGAVAVAFFIAVFFAEGLDPYLMGTYEWLLGHPGVTSALAFSPLACSLLVGYGYASRARKRKKLAAQRAAAAAATPEAESSP